MDLLKQRICSVRCTERHMIGKVQLKHVLSKMVNGVHL